MFVPGIPSNYKTSGIMTKKYFYSSLAAILSVLYVSCDADNEDLRGEDLNAKMMGAFIYDSDLVGEWNLNAMVTDKEIDLNGDKVFTKDLMAETSCFDPMSIIFNGDKTFVSVNSRMDFLGGESGDEFECMADRTDRGKWSLENDILIMYVNVNGKEEKHTKQLIYSEGVFAFEVNRMESQAYVTDPGNLSVSKVSVVALEYNKVK